LKENFWKRVGPLRGILSVRRLIVFLARVDDLNRGVISYTMTLLFLKSEIVFFFSHYESSALPSFKSISMGHFYFVG